MPKPENKHLYDASFVKEASRVKPFKMCLKKKKAKPKQYNIGIDTFERAKANMSKKEIRACAIFNIDKYAWRKKNQDKADFEKIKAYADLALSTF